MKDAVKGYALLNVNPQTYFNRNTIKVAISIYSYRFYLMLQLNIQIQMAQMFMLPQILANPDEVDKV
jgi:hypothetical protein